MSRAPGVQVVHSAVAGRVRVRVPGLKGQPALCESLERRIAGCEGVRSAEANARTGNLLVWYAPEALALDQLLACVAEASGASLACPPEGAPTEGDWRGPLGEVLTRLPAYARLGWTLARSPEIPRRRKAGLLTGVLYSLLPIDLVPGFIPVLGQMDDIAALLLGLRSALRALPPQRAGELLARYGLAEEQLDDDLATLRRVALTIGRGLIRRVRQGGRMVSDAVGRARVAGERGAASKGG